MSATPPDKVPAPPGVILVADDEESIRWVLERACAKDGHTVHAVGSGREALAALRERAYDVALIDIRMPDLSGLEVLSHAREDHIDTLFIIMTAQNTMANAIEATKRGAYDYLTKPFDLDQVQVLVGGAMELRRLTRDLERLRGELEQRDELVVGKTSAMQEVYKVIGRAAPTEATVLIQGETGTGKELVAKTIHYHSERRGPFVALTARRSPTSSSRASSSATSAAPSPARWSAASGSSRPRPAGRSSSTRSPTCPSRCRRSSCASSRSASSPGSAAATRCTPTSASSRPRTRTS